MHKRTPADVMLPLDPQSVIEILAMCFTHRMLRDARAYIAEHAMSAPQTAHDTDMLRDIWLLLEHAARGSTSLHCRERDSQWERKAEIARTYYRNQADTMLRPDDVFAVQRDDTDYSSMDECAAADMARAIMNAREAKAKRKNGA